MNKVTYDDLMLRSYWINLSATGMQLDFNLYGFPDWTENLIASCYYCAGYYIMFDHDKLKLLLRLKYVIEDCNYGK